MTDVASMHEGERSDWKEWWWYERDGEIGKTYLEKWPKFEKIINSESPQISSMNTVHKRN